MQTAQLDPQHWFGTFGFTRPEHYLYEVEPEDLGRDARFSCAAALIFVRGNRFDGVPWQRMPVTLGDQPPQIVPRKPSFLTARQPPFNRACLRANIRSGCIGLGPDPDLA